MSTWTSPWSEFILLWVRVWDKEWLKQKQSNSKDQLFQNSKVEHKRSRSESKIFDVRKSAFDINVTNVCLTIIYPIGIAISSVTITMPVSDAQKKLNLKVSVIAMRLFGSWSMGLSIPEPKFYENLIASLCLPYSDINSQCVKSSFTPHLMMRNILTTIHMRDVLMATTLKKNNACHAILPSVDVPTVWLMLHNCISARIIQLVPF